MAKNWIPACAGMTDLKMTNLRTTFSRFLALLVISLLMTSCSHLSRPDGPPNFYVDETKIPNAVPKKEPLAKYGNMTSYRVNGKRYYVMKSVKNYNQIGTASWYGTKFHDHRTSSGEKYDMLAMTAAHKTLPLPTYVEVTNLKNHRKIIVKVNDRGPFSSNRLIDLSYVGAKKLGMLGHGTTYVRVKAIDVNHTDAAPIMMAENKQYSSFFSHHSTRSKTMASPVYLQVGAFRHREGAIKMQQHLSGLLATPVAIMSPHHTSKLYRVQVGPIKDMATADALSHRLTGLLGTKPNKVYGA